MSLEICLRLIALNDTLMCIGAHLWLCAYLEDPVACLVPTTRVRSCIGCPAPKPLNLLTHPARDASIATDCFCLSNFSKRLQGCSNQQEECSKSNSNATLHCTVYWEKKLYKKSWFAIKKFYRLPNFLSFSEIVQNMIFLLLPQNGIYLV